MPETPEGPEANPQTPRGAGRWVKIALAVSLSLNLLIIGLVGGAILGRAGSPEAPAIRSLGLGPFAFALPRESRDDIRQRMTTDLPELRRNRAEIGASLLSVRRALLQEPFDRDAVSAALGRSRDAAFTIQSQAHEALLLALEEMTPAERAEVAERLGRTLRRMARADRGPRE